MREPDCMNLWAACSSEAEVGCNLIRAEGSLKAEEEGYMTLAEGAYSPELAGCN